MISVCRLIIITLLSFLVNGSQENSEGKLVLCNYAPKYNKRPGPAVFDLDNFDPNICTHFIYHGSTIDEETYNMKMTRRESGLTDEEMSGLLNKTLALRERSPDLKIILGICCIDEDTWGSGALIEQRVSNFKKNVVQTLQTYGFDGLYISGGSGPENRLVASELREEFDKYGFLLSKFVFPPSYGARPTPDLTSDAAASYHLLILGSCLQFDANSSRALSPPSLLRETVEAYLSRGIPPEKMVVPIPTISAAYEYCERNDSEVSGEICAPENKRGKDILQHHELMRMMNDDPEGWVVTRDNETGMLYGLSNSNIWTSYEDPVSVGAKAQYIIEKNLAGGIILNVESDDFAGYNEEGIKFPLTKALHKALRGN